MWDRLRDTLADAISDFRGSWRYLAVTDIAYKALAFALLTPATALLMRRLASLAHTTVVADTDIAAFFVTTRVGVVMLVLGGAILAAITALEAACLMAIGMARANGVQLNGRSALVFGARRAPWVLGLTGHMVLRLMIGLLPFAAAIAAVQYLMLRTHDINYYLTQKPPAFFVALALAAVIVATLAVVLVWTVARWALALPLVLFEGVLPRRALGESARRSQGNRWLVVLALAVWAALGGLLLYLAGWLPEVLGRALAPAFAGSLPALLAFVALLALLWLALAISVGVVNASLFSLVILRLYLRVGTPREPRVPQPVGSGRFGLPAHLGWKPRTAILAVGVLACTGFALLALYVTRSNRPVVVIAHRGASAAAPENTLAAFRLACEQGTDYVALDVQESADGEVLVVHDSDLMKLGNSPAKIWETDAARLRSIDIGSHKGPLYAGERVPTLAQALAVCKGKARVVIELKSYGHDQKLVERVAAIVEAAGMQNDCAYMSLDHVMIGRMKRLRPDWRCGALVAKSLGDLTSLHADFLAVEARLASGRFVRRAHRAGQEVYVWTVDDPAWMLAAMSHGVDGLITNKPDLAREVIARREAMSDGQRFLLAVLIRAGARTEMLEAEGALRP